MTMSKTHLKPIWGRAFGRTVWASVVLGVAVALSTSSMAAGLADLSSADASKGLKEALSKGAAYAVQSLGKPDGFLGNAQVRIGLPGSLQKAEAAVRLLGGGPKVDALVTTMNRAAEQAVVLAKPVLADAIKKMTVVDAKNILTGPDDSATQYFRRTTSDQLTARFMPIVKQATQKVHLGDKYQQFAGAAAAMGLINAQDASLDGYITQKTLDGLFLLVAEQEKAIRQDPLGSGSQLLSKVFGVVR